MPNYNNIKNEELRKLVMLSESIKSQPEDKAQDMINQIANLTGEEQEAMISTLKDEQNDIKKAKLAKGITPEKEMTMIEEKTTKVRQIKHDFEASVLKIEDKKEREESSKAADKLIEELDK